METALSVNGNPKPTIRKVRFTHDAVIDDIILDPSVSQGELARKWGFTEAWLSIIINSDAFKNRLKERKAEMVDPQIIATVNERLDSLAQRSLDKLLDRLEGRDPLSPGPIKTPDLIAMAKLGVGDKNTRVSTPTHQSLYVVNLPPPAQDSKTWLESTNKKPEMVIDVTGVNRE